MRDEQRDAVDKAYEYYHSIWAEESDAVPEFLWNAKMRFGKTFATYQLAKKLHAKRVLIITFKPAVEMHGVLTRCHTSISKGGSTCRVRRAVIRRIWIRRDRSFSSACSRTSSVTAAGNFKAKHRWLTDMTWDLVVFDEYHFGAWRDAAKELFEGEDDQTIRAEARTDKDQDAFAEQAEEFGDDPDAFVPVRARSYLYPSGRPSKYWKEGRFIEEQIFNWTYTDEQREGCVRAGATE